MEIRAANWPDDLPTARRLLSNYLDFLRSNPAGPVDVCTAGYEEELATLDERYDGHNAVLLLAELNGASMGCVAIKQRPDRPGSCEMKRLWTEPNARGLGLGKQLVEAAMHWSRLQNAQTLLLDTVAAAMPAAVSLYRAAGFVETERHNANTVSGLLFMKVDLR